MSEFTMNTESESHWYRNPWVWMVIAIPFSAVLFGIVMIVSATRFPDDVVVDNYYKEGKAINQRIEMDTVAANRDIVAIGSVQSGRIEFEISGAYDSAVVMNLFHVTDSDLDRQIVLLPESGNLYAASVESLPFDEAGVWYVELEGTDSGWRVRERFETPVTTLELKPK